MLRFEHAGKFWTIRRVGAVITTTYGKIGNKGRMHVKHHPNDGAAKAAHDQLVLDKQREGYRLVESDKSIASESGAPADDDASAGLEAALIADPDDVNAFTVYGDWLLKHGDARGELVALQHADSKNVGKYLAEHAGYLLGALARLVPDIRQPDGPPFWWRHGFIRRAELVRPEVVAELLAHPSAKFLVELAIRTDTRHDTLEILGDISRAPQTLRSFELFARANLDRVRWKPVPKLERLDFVARAFELVELEQPSLRRLRVAATSIASTTVAAIVAAPWPNLERLDIRFCRHNGNTEADFHDLQPLLVRSDLPKLTQLKLRGAPFSGAVARALVGSPLAKQLEVLGFSNGNFTPNDIKWLADHAAYFPALRELWVPTEDAARALAKLAKHVVSDSRGPADMLDYELAGER